MGLILITVSMTACGGETKEKQSESESVVSTVSLENQEKVDSRESDEKVQSTELELPFWKGFIETTPQIKSIGIVVLIFQFSSHH